jgi:hypothetical protein
MCVPAPKIVNRRSFSNTTATSFPCRGSSVVDWTFGQGDTDGDLLIASVDGANVAGFQDPPNEIDFSRAGKWAIEHKSFGDSIDYHPDNFYIRLLETLQGSN